MSDCDVVQPFLSSIYFVFNHLNSGGDDVLLHTYTYTLALKNMFDFVYAASYAVELH